MCRPRARIAAGPDVPQATSAAGQTCATWALPRIDRLAVVIEEGMRNQTGPSRGLVTVTDLGAHLSTVPAVLFTCPLGDDAALIPRTVSRLRTPIRGCWRSTTSVLPTGSREHSTSRRRWKVLVRTWSAAARRGLKDRSCRWPTFRAQPRLPSLPRRRR